MGKWKGSKKLKDIFRVLMQFLGPIGEGAKNGRGCGIPCDGPVSVKLDDLGRFAPANREIEVSDGGGGFVISEGGKQSREDNIKVDCCSREDVLPLGLWKRWE